MLHCFTQSTQTAAASYPAVLVHTLPSEEQRSSPESGKGKRKPLLTINKVTRRLCCENGWDAGVKKKPCGEGRGEATGEATLAVVASKPHTGGPLLMVGHSQRNEVSVGERQHFGLEDLVCGSQFYHNAVAYERRYKKNGSSRIVSMEKNGAHFSFSSR